MRAIIVQCSKNLIHKIVAQIICQVDRTGAIDQLDRPRAKVLVKGEHPERFLGLDLTQFDVKRRIPSSSLGSWDNFSGLARGQSGSKIFWISEDSAVLPYPLGRSLGFPTRVGVRCPDHGAGVWKPGQRARVLPTAIQTENRAHVAGSGPATSTTLHRRHT